jgi:hypothetical protein
VVQTYLALQHDFSPPPKSRLWVYNWDGRKGMAGSQLYDHLKISHLSEGTLAAPIKETTLYEEDYSIISYGENMLDDDENYLSLDAPLAALPSIGGILVVRRGNFDASGAIVNYDPNSAILKVKVDPAGTGTATVENLSGNQNISENIEGAIQVNPNTVRIRAVLAAGAFAIRNYNWRSNANPNWNYLIVYQLIGRPGAFTGAAKEYAFAMAAPDSPCGFFEIPLPTKAEGVSFVVYAAIQTGPNIYSLIADSFPIGTTYGDHFVNAFDDEPLSAPYTVSDMSANVIAGLPSAKNGVFTITDDTRHVILERAVPYGTLLEYNLNRPVEMVQFAHF